MNLGFFFLFRRNSENSKGGDFAMKKVVATMAGTIVEILVETGDEVAIGQSVAILESMKMEIPIESEVVGKVSSIKVSVGDFVNEGDVLMELH
jgi:acetyl-CoA carboxylase biotin carboxyl carrier protein